MKSVRTLVPVCILAAASSPLSGQSPHRVQGRVVDAATAQAIPASWIELSGTDYRRGTDATGAFTLELAAGSHTLIAHAFGYRSATFQFQLRTDTTLSLQLQAEPLALQELEVQADRLTARSRALPWSVRAVTREQLAASAAATPVDVLKQRRVILIPCPSGTVECVRYRMSPTPVLVCIDERMVRLSELQNWPNGSLYKIEVHDRGRMIRAYTVGFMEQVLAGKRDFRHVLRSDDPSC